MKNMNSSKKAYLGMASGMLFLFLLTCITFIVIGIYKEGDLFEEAIVAICLAFSLLILLVGGLTGLYMAFKQTQISDPQN